MTVVQRRSTVVRTVNRRLTAAVDRTVRGVVTVVEPPPRCQYTTSTSDYQGRLDQSEGDTWHWRVSVREIPTVDPLEELRKEMEIYFERLKQEREQEDLLEVQREQELREQELVSQREQELLAQKQTAQEEDELSPNVLFRQFIEETCGNNGCEEEKQRMEDFMVEFLEDCEQKMIT
ncbi:hypothetical protein Tco_0542302 [Tanacetum coccineum]